MKTFSKAMDRRIFQDITYKHYKNENVIIFRHVIDRGNIVYYEVLKKVYKQKSK